jgi:DNA-binding transcriptional regulator/RsmH inhibitor MraZ
MSGEVVVAGRIDFLEVWNHERFTARLEAEPLTDDDLKALSERGF